MREVYEGRRGTNRQHRRKTPAEAPPHKYMKNFGKQLFFASLILTVVFFTKDMDSPVVKQSREALKYAVNQNIDWGWFQSGLTELLQSWTDGSTRPDVPAESPLSAPQTSKETPFHAGQSIPAEAQL